MFLTGTPTLAAESITSGLDGPIYGISSPYALVVIFVRGFCDTGEMGFCSFLFIDDLARILATFSLTATSLSGESCSLKISMMSWLLCMPHQSPYRITKLTPSLDLATFSIFSSFLNSSLNNSVTLQFNVIQICTMVYFDHRKLPLIAPNQLILHHYEINSIIMKKSFITYPNLPSFLPTQWSNQPSLRVTYTTAAS